MQYDGANFVIIRADGKVLLQKRDNIPTILNPGKWCIPGGSVEGTETLLQTVVREIEEETGLVLREEDCQEFLDFVWEKNGVPVIDKFFLIRVDDPVIKSREGKMYWKTLDEAEKLGLANDGNKVLLKVKQIL